MEKTFYGKKALVVGGTGGIGKAAAIDLAKRGADLTIHGGSSQERLENTLKIIRENNGTAEGFLLPIKGPQAAEEIFKSCKQPDILVCAWGPFGRRSLENADSSFWQSMVEGNLIIPGILVSLALPGMLKKNWGRILLFGGTNTDTIRGYSTSAAYSAAKTALGVLAKSVVKNVAGYAEQAACNSYPDITCNVICPGLTDTEYLDNDLRQYNREKSPGGKPLDVFEVSKVCMDILENSGVTGAIIPVDRGISI
ncbi:MAG: SDR family oxidoreductase [Treponema sp.]|nr:SDR family oxidoreductase [Treponema sp.]